MNKCQQATLCISNSGESALFQHCTSLKLCLGLTSLSHVIRYCSYNLTLPVIQKKKMNKILTIIVIFLTTITLSSCTQKKMEYVDFEKSYKMYFIDVHYQNIKHSECNFIETYKNFYIDEHAFLDILKNELILEKSKIKGTDCLYAVTILQENEITFGAFLDMEHGIINASNIYDFDIEKFLANKEKFKKLEAFEVNCYSLSKTKKLINDIENAGGYIFGYTGNEEPNVFSYLGRMKLLVAPSLIEPNMEYEKIKKRLVGKFSKLDEIDIISYHNIQEDSITIEILCNKNFSSQMPEGFQVLEPFTDSINLPFAVYDMSNLKIRQTAKKLNIINLEIKDLND